MSIQLENWPEVISQLEKKVRKRRGRKYHDAEDFAQEAVLKLLTLCEKGAELQNPLGLLDKAAMFASDEAFRKEKRRIGGRTRIDLNEVACDGFLEIDRKELREAIDAAIGRLPPDLMRVSFRKAQVRTLRSIGKELDLHEREVSRCWCRARARLRILLECCAGCG